MATKKPPPKKSSRSLGAFEDGLPEDSGFRPKDFRLVLANRYAAEAIKKIKAPKTPKELRARISKVATVVAGKLYTAPTVALSAYINPTLWEKWQSVSKPSPKPPQHSAVAARAIKVEEILGNLFRARWKAVAAELAKGIDVAKARAPYFLSSDSLARLRAARRHYTLTRAREFANLSNAEIAVRCWAWVNPFQVFAHHSGNDLAEIEAQLETLVASEYVAMTWGLFDNFPGYTESTEEFDPEFPQFLDEFCSLHPPHVYPLPDLTTECGDVYEAIVYSYQGERLRVCKSISEPFLAAERADAMDEIERGFFDNAREEGDDPRDWSVKFRRLTTFVLPEYGRALIEADVFGEVGTPDQKEKYWMLKEELKLNRNGYLRRSRVSSRRQH